MRGASKGEGLGNKFLGHIREVDAIVEVVRCFDPAGCGARRRGLDPLRDVETIRTELALSDLETLHRSKVKTGHQARTGDKHAKAELEVLEHLEEALDRHQTARKAELTAAQREIARGIPLLTTKPVIYVANVGESDLGGANAALAELEQLTTAESTEVVAVCAELESELADLSPEEAAEYLSALEVKGSGADELIQSAYRVLGLITFFTGEREGAAGPCHPRRHHGPRRRRQRPLRHPARLHRRGGHHLRPAAEGGVDPITPARTDGCARRGNSTRCRTET